MPPTGKKNQARGAQFERESVTLLHGLGYGTARRTGCIQANGAGDPDITGIPGVWISCKRWKTVRWLLWWRDALDRTPPGQAPLIIHRGDGGEAMVSLRLRDLPVIIQAFQDSESVSKALWSRRTRP